jgi:hypothetical protein
MYGAVPYIFKVYTDCQAFDPAEQPSFSAAMRRCEPATFSFPLYINIATSVGRRVRVEIEAA